jgi:hypothetical protein
MNVSRVHQREDQVAELTRGQNLPLEPIREFHLIFIAEVLTRAWADLLSKWPATLLSGAEAEINALIESRLNTFLDEDGPWSQLVRCVARGKETVSYDGSHLEKQPDLSIYLTYRTPSFPLVVECKLVDAPSGKKIELYCSQGLARFLRGEYAWAVREAFMLGYVRDGSTVLSCLTPFLAQSRASKPDTYQTEALPTSMTSHGPAELARSRHNRTFRYIRSPRNEPGTIAVWHLWTSTRPQ